MRGHKRYRELGPEHRDARHGRHGKFGRGRGGGRFLDHGELRYVVLALLAERERHGYDIIRAIDESTGGAYSPSPGVIYPTLQLLQDVGHATLIVGEGARNTFQITPEGREFLKVNRTLIDDIMDRMKRVGRTQASPRIAAAMDDLKSALRSSSHIWSEKNGREIAAAIHSAADRIRALRDGADTEAK
ncbi:MAG: PadR family transcriptional regulator [Hyphomicrobiaceae bacterium]